jgi:hypothetical protein
MTSDLAASASPVHPIEAIYRLYEALVLTHPLDADASLGGKLLYAGEMDARGRELLIASNIAGAASLAASADPVVQRQAVRDGAIDFLVTSLEEALRILKNEIRKRQPVSVGVGVAPHTLVAAMLDRGVLPDILPRWGDAELGQFVLQGARQIADQLADPSEAEMEFVTWSVDRDFTRWMPRLDACVRAVISPGHEMPGDEMRKRWLKLSPRYLGRMAQREHGVALKHNEADDLEIRVRQLVSESTSEAGQPVVIKVRGRSIL